MSEQIKALHHELKKSKRKHHVDSEESEDGEWKHADNRDFDMEERHASEKGSFDDDEIEETGHHEHEKADLYDWGDSDDEKNEDSDN